MSYVAIPVFPGTNSEEETLRACHAVGLEARLVWWFDDPALLREAAAYVVPGGFAYEDRIRAGAVAAHDALMDPILEGAQAGKLVLGICNGAQVLLEAGLVPGTGPLRRPTAAFAKNLPWRKFVSRHVYVRLAIAPERCAITAALPADAVIPMWAAHGEGRLAAHPDELARIASDGHLAFAYCDHNGNVVPEATPNGSALGCAALTNREGNVLAIMPHPERDGWTYQHRDGTDRMHARGDKRAMLAPSGGIALFVSFARALERSTALELR